MKKIVEAIGPDWASVSDVATRAGLTYFRTSAELKKLEITGYIVQECPGGRVRLTTKKYKKKRLPKAGPPEPLIHFDTRPDTLYWLDEQYEPASTLDVAWGVGITLDEAHKNLLHLQDHGDVEDMGNDEWVSL